MILVTFFKFIRWKNLLMLAFIQLLLKYVLLKKYDVATSLDNNQFSLLIFSTITIAAGGYIINDIVDRKTDAINKPNKLFVGNYFSTTQSIIYYLILSLTGVIAGIHLSNIISSPENAIFFVSIAFLLFLYSIALKKIALVGNLTIALLTGFSLFIINLMDVIPNFKDGNRIVQLLVINIITVYAIFSIAINFIREIIKDIEDIEGDFSENMKTLPILIGRKRTRNVALVLTILFTTLLVLLLFWNKDLSDYIFAYGIIAVVLPLLYLIYKMHSAETKSDFKNISSLLKLIMVFGMLSILVL